MTLLLPVLFMVVIYFLNIGKLNRTVFGMPYSENSGQEENLLFFCSDSA